MKKLVFITLIFSNLLIAQSDNYNINFISCKLGHNIELNRVKDVFGIDSINREKLYFLKFKLDIDNVNSDSFMDLNNFYLTDNENKIRYRPHYIDYKRYIAHRVKLEDLTMDDNFMNYKIDGYTDLDHYEIKRNSISAFTEFSYRYRFEIPEFWWKKKKTTPFCLIFAVKNKDSGNFSLYYKDQLVKNIVL